MCLVFRRSWVLFQLPQLTFNDDDDDDDDNSNDDDEDDYSGGGDDDEDNNNNKFVNIMTNKMPEDEKGWILKCHQIYLRERRDPT
jgi:hypothetical protein